MRNEQAKTRTSRRRWWDRLKPGGEGSADSPRSLEETFLEHLELIERAAELSGRRAGLPTQEIEDFVSIVKVRLIEDDYAVLRKHRGESELGTYLTAVVKNLFKDHCVSRFGKYRPSVAAKHLGTAAIALERLLAVDRLELESAIEMLIRHHEVKMSRDALREIAAQLPPREPRRMVGEAAIEAHGATDAESAPEHRLVEDERTRTAPRVEEVLDLALETLDAQDVLILKMHFRDGLPMSEIARVLRLPQRRLYSRRDRSLESLRRVFEARGLGWDAVRTILGWDRLEIHSNWTASRDAGAAEHGIRPEDGP